MKLTCNRKSLLDAFADAASIVPNRTTKPVLQHVKLETNGTADSVLLSSTDLEIAIRCRAANVDVLHPGAMLLPAAKTISILRALNDDVVNIAMDDRAISITSERGRFSMPRTTEELPSMQPEDSDENCRLMLESESFRTLLQRTTWACDAKGGRYILEGVNLEFEPDRQRLVAVATDRHALACAHVQCEAAGDVEKAFADHVLVPQRAAMLMLRTLPESGPAMLAVHTNDIAVTADSTTIVSRRLAGRFPRWRKMFDEFADVVSQSQFLAGELATAIQQASLFADVESRGVHFRFNGDRLVMQSQAAETGESCVELAIETTGESEFTINPQLVAGFLRPLYKDLVVQLAAAKVPDRGVNAALSAGEDCRCLIMGFN